jgi:hypothetical protein
MACFNWLILKIKGGDVVLAFNVMDEPSVLIRGSNLC